MKFTTQVDIDKYEDDWQDVSTADNLFTLLHNYAQGLEVDIPKHNFGIRISDETGIVVAYLRPNGRWDIDLDGDLEHNPGQEAVRLQAELWLADHR